MIYNAFLVALEIIEIASAELESIMGSRFLVVGVSMRYLHYRHILSARRQMSLIQDQTFKLWSNEHLIRSKYLRQRFGEW